MSADRVLCISGVLEGRKRNGSCTGYVILDILGEGKWLSCGCLTQICSCPCSRKVFGFAALDVDRYNLLSALTTLTRQGGIFMALHSVDVNDFEPERDPGSDFPHVFWIQRCYMMQEGKHLLHLKQHRKAKRSRIWSRE